jgi:hypothetical protein
MLAARCSPDRSVIWLVVGVLAWWLVVFEVIMPLMPALVETVGTPAHAITPGRWAYIDAPSLQAWPIPTDREIYEGYKRAQLTDDPDVVTGVIARSEWVPVANRDAVRVLAVDGDAVRVQLLEGQSVGRRGWVEVRQLRLDSP